MANLFNIPATARVVEVLQPDPTARFHPAASGVYAKPLDPIVKSTCQRADLWLVVGMVGKVRSLEGHAETPLTTATVDHWFDRWQCAYDFDEITVNVVNRMNRNKNKIFKNAQFIVHRMSYWIGGFNSSHTWTRDQSINIFRLFYRQDPFSAISALLAGATADSVNLDVIFNGNNNYGIIEGSTAFDQVTVLQQWFEFLFEETCDMFARHYIVPIPCSLRLARLPDWRSRRQLSDAWLALRGEFMARNNTTVNLLDPRNLPI